ncbi:ATP-binding protein [Gramella sp. AN32]|uniref:histidine kinase n=1 Tax=Christiangramia antarctica TaxID=2058158 RepID=A0ABW5X591_9FLAO|nr:ATP-binding protein [Gramella sp. AN32]MCM4154660.1 hypothetical protein [Gramella sp. AN32]
MKPPKFHRLLNRQLKKVGLDDMDPDKLSEFLNLVNDAYQSFDKDILRVENILEESSKELFIANQNLKQERDTTQTKLKNIVDNVKGVIFETDLEGNFTYLNKAWHKYVGVSVQDTLGKNYKEFLNGKDQKLNEKLEKYLQKKQSYFKTIFKYQTEKEKSIWVELKFVLVTDSTDWKTGYIGTMIDVTNLKEAEIGLKKASAAKDNFLSTMSHEIRTPLNAVTGLANILLMEEYLPSQLENLKALKYSGEHLLGLINDLLDFHKIQSGEVELIENDINLTQLLKDIKSHFKLKADKKNLNFQVLVEEDVPLNIKGDKLKLTQILNNLLSNALKFTEEGSIILRVSKLAIEKNKVRLEFKITDTGIGISKVRQRSIFKSFIQENQNTSLKYGGTGLGLAISKKLLNLQGSDLNVESEPGKGASFSFKIKYKVSNELDSYNPAAIRSEPDYKPLYLDVLIAEDNKINVLILTRFFAKWEVSYKVAGNGEEVLEIYKDSDFDLILMDIQMPILDGYKTTNSIRNLPDSNKAEIPIIALTAFAQTDIKEKTESYKMNGFLGKPFNPLELYNILKSYTTPKTTKRKHLSNSNLPIKE